MKVNYLEYLSVTKLIKKIMNTHDIDQLSKLKEPIILKHLIPLIWTRDGNKKVHDKYS